MPFPEKMNNEEQSMGSFSIAWFFVSIGGVFIADAINYYVFEELPVPYYKLFGEIVIRFKEKNCKLINLNKDE